METEWKQELGAGLNDLSRKVMDGHSSAIFCVSLPTGNATIGYCEPLLRNALVHEINLEASILLESKHLLISSEILHKTFRKLKDYAELIEQNMEQISLHTMAGAKKSDIINNLADLIKQQRHLVKELEGLVRLNPPN